MAFTSLKYLVFLVVACLLYFILPKKVKNLWLLICSYFFYMSWNAKYAILMMFSTFITYLSGLLISKSDTKKKKLVWVISSLIINLGILFIFKYYSFVTTFINHYILSCFKLQLPSSLNLLLPVGISFYTFQALSYTIDVYRKDQEVEKNIINYALFVSFFPQLVAGPIEKSKDLLSQFKNVNKFSWDNMCKGALLILIGFFYKLVISDRAATIVNQVYNNVSKYSSGGGIYFIVATFLFAIQIYFDFNAYSTIARGSAKIMGYNLSINFKRPYLAKSIKDFWSRWHISLSSWFKTYLYIPLGGNRKGKVRTQINTLIVFLTSGLWHGAAWTFVIWGATHGILQVLENTFNRNKSKKNNVIINIFKIIITFIMVDFAWIFFRANSISDAFIVIKNLFSFGMPISYELFNTSLIELIILGGLLIVMCVIDVISEKYNIEQLFYKQNIIVRWLFYYLLLFIVIIFGIYGPGFDIQEFIYFQF